MADPKSPSAFISYSHDSDDHAGRVLELANALRDHGINVILDQYVHPAPERAGPVGWTGTSIRPSSSDGLHRDLPPPRHGPRGAR